MARYMLGFTTAAAVAGAGFADLATTSTDRVRLLEVGLFCQAATAVAGLTLERTSAVGTRTTPVTGVPGDTSEPAGTATVATAWSVAPTFSAVALRAGALSANIGAGVIWTFAFGDLTIPVSSSIVLINRSASTAGVCRGYFMYDE